VLLVLAVILTLVLTGDDATPPSSEQVSAPETEDSVPPETEEADATRERARTYLIRAEEFAQANPDDAAGVARRDREIETKFPGTAEADAAGDALASFVERHEKAARRKADSLVSKALRLARTGDADAARQVLAEFPAHYADTEAEKRIRDAMLEVDDLAIQHFKRRTPDTKEEAAEVAEEDEDEDEADVLPDEPLWLGPPSQSLMRRFDQVRFLAMEFEYDLGLEVTRMILREARTEANRAYCRYRLAELQAQQALFTKLQRLLSGEREGPEVTFGKGAPLRVKKADAEGIEASSASQTSRQAWSRLPPEDLEAVLEWAGEAWAEPLAIAGFAFDHGLPAIGDEMVKGVVRSYPDRAFTWLARRRGTEVPGGGYLLYVGDWRPKEEVARMADGEVQSQGRWRSRADLAEELDEAKRARKESAHKARVEADRKARREELLEKGIAEVRTLRYRGDVSRRVDIAIVADGFTLDAGKSFERSARAVTDSILKVPPFRNYTEYINIHLVRLFEKEAGISEPPDRPRTTKLGSALVDGILSCDLDLAEEFGREAPDADLVVVIANTVKGRPAGGSGVVVLNTKSAADSVIHELGHAFGDLLDEYVDERMAEKFGFGEEEEGVCINVTRESDPRKVKWHYWNFPPVPGKTIGCFEGAFFHKKGYYRAAENCRMRRRVTQEFCLVCQEQMERSFLRQLEPIDRAAPESREVFAWVDETARFEIVATTIAGKPAYGKFRSEWWVGGERTDADKTATRKTPDGKAESCNSLEVKAGTLGPGRHEVAVHVEMENERIRRDHGLLSSTRVWTLVVSPNRRPRLQIPDEVRGRIRHPLAFSIGWRDTDSPFQVEVQDLPDGAFFDPERGLFRWIPTRLQEGRHRIEVIVGDAVHRESFVTDLHVTGPGGNTGPVMTDLGSLKGTEGTDVDFTVEAVDVDGDRLVYWAEDLPDGATLDARTGEFSWVPTHLQAGTYTVRLRAGDAREVDRQDVNLRIDDRPVAGSTVFQDFDIVLGLRSDNFWVRSEAMDQLKETGIATLLIREHARRLRFPGKQESSEALAALRKRLIMGSAREKAWAHLEFLRAVAPHCRQLVDFPEALTLVQEAVDRAEQLSDIDKRTRQAIGGVRDELEAIRKYNKDRSGD
jgi:hypothetical protein